MKNKHCEWCDHQFQTKINYQIYCSPECREAATKEKIAARYIATRIKKRSGKLRVCKVCSTRLSIYNDDQYCNVHEPVAKDIKKALKDIKALSDGKDI
jgi:hypothetical protein